MTMPYPYSDLASVINSISGLEDQQVYFDGWPEEDEPAISVIVSTGRHLQFHDVPDGIFTFYIRLLVRHPNPETAREWIAAIATEFNKLHNVPAGDGFIISCRQENVPAVINRLVGGTAMYMVRFRMRMRR